MSCSANTEQGFDEFMNLVIDDAVEVKLAHKDQEEARRSLGEPRRQS
jgi:small nuclear ribonucleoprotein E